MLKTIFSIVLGLIIYRFIFHSVPNEGEKCIKEILNKPMPVNSQLQPEITPEPLVSNRYKFSRHLEGIIPIMDKYDVITGKVKANIDTYYDTETNKTYYPTITEGIITLPVYNYIIPGGGIIGSTVKHIDQESWKGKYGTYCRLKSSGKLLGNYYTYKAERCHVCGKPLTEEDREYSRVRGEYGHLNTSAVAGSTSHYCKECNKHSENKLKVFYPVIVDPVYKKCLTPKKDKQKFIEAMGLCSRIAHIENARQEHDVNAILPELSEALNYSSIVDYKANAEVADMYLRCKALA